MGGGETSIDRMLHFTEDLQLGLSQTPNYLIKLSNVSICIMLDILIISGTYASQAKYYCIKYKQIEAS